MECCKPQSFARVVAASLLLAAGYALLGRLALLLAIPPGYATAIWPPAGLSLAAVMLGGRRVLAGVWLGSAVTNAWLASGSSAGLTGPSLVVAAGIAIGATAQALAGVTLMRRWLRRDPDLLHPGSISAMLLFGGPAACLIGATSGVTALRVAGVLPAAAVPFSWATWYVGDTIGVLIFTPLCLALLRQDSAAWRGRRLTVGVPLLLGCVVAVFVFRYADRWEVHRAARELDQIGHRFEATLRSNMDRAFDATLAVDSLYQSSENVTADEFTTFAAPVVAHNASLHALSWADRVFDPDRVSYESTTTGSAGRPLRVRERVKDGTIVPASTRAEYMVVRHLEPLAGNENALGFDMACDGERARAIALARDSGCPQLTGRVQLARQNAADPGLLFIVPHYRPGADVQTVAQRRENLIGVVTGVFRIEHLLAETLRSVNAPGIGVTLEDESSHDAASRRLFGGGAADATPGERSAWSGRLDLAGRRWSIGVRSAPDAAAGRTLNAWLVLACGLLFSGLLGFLLLVLTGHIAIERHDRIALQAGHAAVDAAAENLRAAHDRLRLANESLEARVAERTAELCRSNEELEQFAYVASHDLQEPLRMVSNYTQLLARRYRNKIDADADEYIEYAVDGARRMRSMIDDTLNYARLGRIVTEKSRVALDQIVGEVVLDLRAAAEERGARIDVGPLPAVAGEASLLRQVMLNLIGNALKFASDQRPCVRVSAERAGELWAVSVSDNGIGIDPAYHAQIFEPFKRLHGTADFPGNGIGLAVCRRIIERHGGEIGVASAEGAGARFWFTVPASPDQLQEAA